LRSHFLQAESRRGGARRLFLCLPRLAPPDLTRLISQIAPENVASQRVAMAVGMQFQRHTLYEGHPHDVYQLERNSVG
jgi:RimJ/RimL family protein N-acetyltransferase